MSNPKVSVCVDVHNYADYLPDALQSILGQSFADFELIIIDDCSTDNSFEIARDCAARDSRTRAIRNSSNLGMVKTWNSCIHEARGDYIKFVQADDYLATPDALGAMVALMESSPAISLLASAMQFVDAAARPTGHWSCFDGKRLLSGTGVIQRCFRDQRNLIGGPSAVMFRRYRAGRGFNGLYSHCADLEMWFHLLEQGCFGFLNEPLCAYRRHAKQDTVKVRNTLAKARESQSLQDEYLGKSYIQLKPWLRNYLIADAAHQVAQQTKSAGEPPLKRWDGGSLLLQSSIVKTCRFFNWHIMPRFQSRPRALPNGINVVGFLTGEYGIGQTSRAFCRAVELTGQPHALVNLRSRDHSNLDTQIRNFSKDNPYRVNLMTFSFDYARRCYRDMGSGFFRNRYNIAVWFWEQEQFPLRCHSAFDYYDEIWVVADFYKTAMEAVSPVPVKKITHPVVMGNPAPDRARFGLDARSYLFLFNFDYGSLIGRKNPMAVIKAFKQAFGENENVALVLKSIDGKLDPEGVEGVSKLIGGANVVRLDEHLRAAEMEALFASIDCYVSLHRSEGFGLGMAQAMALGKPVIATGYSGNLEFMNSSNSLLVRYRTTELDQTIGRYERGSYWAEPDLEHAAELMRWVYTHREEAAQIGMRAARDIREKLSPEKTKEEILARLRELNQRDF